MFGDNGLSGKNIDTYSVIKRFTRCDSKLHTLGKLIINLRKVRDSVFFFNPHILLEKNDMQTKYVECKSIDPARKRVVSGGNIPDNIENEPAELYHFRNKTYEEVVKRKMNGCACFPKNSPYMKSWTDMD